MSERKNTYRGRLLPTYRWDDWDTRKSDPHQLSDLDGKLLVCTAEVLKDFMADMERDGTEVLPPQSVIFPILEMNVSKRSSATRKAEHLIEKGEITIPPSSMIPTFMNSGHAIPGVEDHYMGSDHPSQELFAYNRLGKTSWQNQKFGAHCLKAIEFAHPNGVVTATNGPLRVKAHESSRDSDKESEGWVILSSKASIATIAENGRRASLISRVTGAVDITSPLLTKSETEAITELTGYERPFGDSTDTRVVMARKALLVDALLRTDGQESSPFRPVIQTVYLTQQPQK